MVKKIFIIIVFLVLIFSAVPYGYAADNTVYIGIIPYYAPDKIWHFYKPFTDYLTKTTDISWELKLYHNYDAIIDGLCSGEVSIAYLGPNSLGLAYEKCKAKPLLVVLGEDGQPFYKSVIFTNNHKINSLKELEGKIFAFGDKESTSSNIVPRKMLEDAGVTMDKIKPIFLKNHEKIINAVAKNEATAGATKDSILKKFQEMKFKILKVSESIPQYSFCALPNINPEIERKFMNALLKLKPLSNKADRDKVKEWDSELRYGFTLPPEYYFQNVLKLRALSKKLNENR